ncbi:MAG: hypothetical protein WDN08_08315 [Rhizomicrobium sp.]
MPDEVAPRGGDPADFFGPRVDHDPIETRRIGRRLAVDLVLDGVGDFLAPLLPPRVARDDRLAVLEPQRIGSLG